MKDIRFLDESDIDEIIIPTIIKNFDQNVDPNISYRDEEKDFQDYLDLLERIKSDLYGKVTRRASFLFVNCNQHLFSNGNKRISLVTTIVFLEKNGYLLDENIKGRDFLDGMVEILGIDVVEHILDVEIGEKIDNWNGGLPYLGFYMIAIVIADKNLIGFNHLQHDELIDLVEIFIKFIIK